MKISFGKVAVGLLLACAVAAGPAYVVSAQTDPIKERKDNRQELRKAMGAVKAVVDAKGDPKSVVPIAENMVKIEAAHVKLYPAGSDKGETKALPAIWTDMAGFQAASKNASDAMGKLAQVAASGDIAAVGAQFGAVGGACQACHDKYRGK